MTRRAARAEQQAALFNESTEVERALQVLARSGLSHAEISARLAKSEPPAQAPLEPAPSAAFPDKESALAELQSRRSWLVQWGRYAAWKLAKERGSVHSRMVHDYLEGMGLLAKSRAVTGHWLGSVFNWFALEKTGEQIQVKTKLIHSRPQPLWRLSGKGRDLQVQEPPMDPPEDQAVE